ncbi:MAG: SAM-dependent methyltransferase [Bacteroidales bacterium]|nr:SAM-dependent methyltransferase [Bacteroidales bacterium]
MKGKLYLIPAPLGEENILHTLPQFVFEIINNIDFYIVEDIRTARRYLKKMGIKKPIDSLTFYVLNEHTQAADIEAFLNPASEHHVGLMSEAGLPGIADPGAELVKLAHKKGIQVIPITGPSSIFLALMASGLNGQNFAFHGYLPIKKPERTQKIRLLEKQSKQENLSQLFIEAPYRNNQLFQDIINTCQPETQLCVAADITQSGEFIATKSIKEWTRQIPELHKKPAIFILQSL